jgi:heme ABC exporter ATP-binding subunit CcmA
MRQLFTNILVKGIRGKSNDRLKHGGEGYPAVEMIGFTVFRGHLPVLREINLIVQQGETVAIMGPNGAGKSTLLRCLGRSLRHGRGEVRWFGSSNTRSLLVRRQIGYVGHECSSYGELTALENLTFAGRMCGVVHPRERAMKLLEAAGLDWAAHRRAESLSQGMRRRLAIARAIVHEPTLILLDEPFASLDANGQRWLDGLFRQWRNEGRTVCFASHDVCQSRLLADRIVWLDCGRIADIEPSDSASARRSA